MTRSIQSRPIPWTTVLLLCGKCARKLDGGFGEKRKQTLRQALRTALKQHGTGRTVRVIETRCLGVCPRKAVMALNASEPGTMLTVPVGEDIDTIVQRMMAPGPAPADA